jgi:predicted alpha/beta superfamily hydrolase
MNTRLAGLVLGCLIVWTLLSPAFAADTADDGAPVTVARARQYELVSRINGETYRIMVATPPDYDPTKSYPALYVLEGNVYFATAADATARQARARSMKPVLVIGIGYPGDDPGVSGTRRWSDLTPSVFSDPKEKRKTGGGDAFLRVLDEEVKPFVAARFKVDATRQALWGHSIGGLTVLRALLLRTDSFSDYLISSPSIWWEGQMVLRDEPSFAKKMSGAGSPVRVLVTSAGEEQYRGTDEKQLAAAQQYRMIDNASDLAERLRRINGSRLSVSRYILEGETHISVSHAALTRSLRFAFPYGSQ